MAYDPNIPQPNDDLDDSQGDLLANFQQLDTSFGIDHYAYSNGTVNNGKHNTVTTPLVIPNPAPPYVHPTTTTDPKFYAMQDSVNLGVLQYTRGPSNAQPTALTCLQSPSAPITLAPMTTTPVLDCSGINSGSFEVTFFGHLLGLPLQRVMGVSTIVFQNSGFTQLGSFTTANITISAVGTTIVISNNSGISTYEEILWTLRPVRIRV